MAPRRGVAALLLILTTLSCYTGTRGAYRATTASCAGRCGEQYNNANRCHCNDACSQYANCCSDYNAICVLGVGPIYNDMCEEFHNCCDDCNALVPTTTVTVQLSCATRCGEAYDSSNTCHCNDRCQEFNNCCDDYNDFCIPTTTTTTTATATTTTTTATVQLSCATRCGEAYDISNTCHCNDRCQEFSNCCDDYGAFCVPTTTVQTTTMPAVPSSPQPVTSAELSSIADDLWYSDVNFAREGVDFTLNLQSYVTNTALHTDSSSSRLFSYMNENSVFSVPTYTTFAAILDNYIAQTGNTEHVTSAESAENEAFLSEIMKTQVMAKVHDFLRWKGIVPYGEAGFKARLNEIWFGRYSRQGGKLDTSGFEHVFVGEVKNGEVSGMHSWVRFYLAEKGGDFDYSGYVFKKQPGTIGVQFRWGSVWKNLGGFFLGTSPEFDVAVYTLCFLTRPDGLCQFTMAGSQMRVTTYSWLDRGQYLATAYP